MRIVIIGGWGQVGAQLASTLMARGHAVSTPSHAEVDVRDTTRLSVWLRRERPDWVINAAAFHDVDRCEAEVALAFAVNAEGAERVARCAREVDARSVYISTDFVFAGDRGRANAELDETGPVNMYGASKRAGEQRSLAVDDRNLVVRTSAVFGRHPCRGKPGSGTNFVDLMVQLGRKRGRVRVIDCETVSPTNAAHLAHGIAVAVADGRAGILHLAGGGAATWFELARAAIAGAGVDAVVERALPDEFKKPAPRPAFSALVTTQGPRLPPWSDGVRDYLGADADRG